MADTSDAADAPGSGNAAGDGGKEIPESVFSDDDGTADARLAQALIKQQSGKGSVADVVDALAYARVLVPVLASGDVRVVGKHGLEQDHVASTGVVAIALPDGRQALPVFTDVDAMKAWNDEARPIPAEGPRAALAAVSEEWSLLVLNPGMETLPIPRPAVWALAQGQAWSPAVVDGVVAADVRDGIAEALGAIPEVRAVDAVAGGGAEVTVVVALAPGLTAEELQDVVARLEQGIAGAEVVALRVDSLQLRLESADHA